LQTGLMDGVHTYLQSCGGSVQFVIVRGRATSG
jgi:hypothetical protein